MQLPKLSTIKSADEARALAIDWQYWQADQALSIGELSEWQDLFESLAKKWPELKEEFIENAII